MRPDLSQRPFELSVERVIAAPCNVLYRAWTDQIDQWIAEPGTVSMTVEPGAPFFFETRFEGQRHPHYGRFLQLVPDELVELTWVTGVPGTNGAETVVKVELAAQSDGTLLTLTHSGFPNEELKDGHAQAWPQGLVLLEQRMADHA